MINCKDVLKSIDDAKNTENSKMQGEEVLFF